MHNKYLIKDKPVITVRFDVIRFCCLFLLIICTSLWVNLGFAQPLETDLEFQKNEIESVERTINPQVQNTDKVIQEKLIKILQSSGKFEDIRVSVQEGVVALSATAQSLQYVSWPSDVAKNIDGVIGVMSDVQAQKIDLKPIQQEFTQLVNAGIELIPLIILGVVVLSFFFFLAKPITHWLMKPILYMIDSILLQTVLRRFITTFICLIGIYFFLRIAGLTQIAVAIVSGTGVLGLIIGFAFKDIAENYISSLLISARRPFQLNDVIEVGGRLGVVQKVTSRGTTLVDFDGNHVQIPNSMIYKSVIKNLTANPKMRGSFIIGIGYDVAIGYAQQIGLDVLQAHPAVINEPEPQLLVDSLGSSTVNLIFYFWIDGHKHALNKVSSSLMKQVVQSYLEHNISMPDDAREIIFPEGIGVNMLEQQISKSRPPKSRTTPIEDDDLASENADIQKQAALSRAPDEGSNIIE